MAAPKKNLTKEQRLELYANLLELRRYGYSIYEASSIRGVAPNYLGQLQKEFGQVGFEKSLFSEEEQYTAIRDMKNKGFSTPRACEAAGATLQQYRILEKKYGRSVRTVEYKRNRKDS